MSALLWLVLAVRPASAADGCVEHGVAAATEAANARVVAADVVGFEREVVRLEAQIACLREPITPAEAADVHLTLGLWHWAHREDALAVASMRAARRADPARLLPDRLYPQGDALRLAFDETPSDGAAATVRVPAARAFWFDGVATRQRPLDRPTLVQVGGLDGRPSVSRVLLPSDPVPSPPWVHTQRRNLAIVSATTGAAAIGLYAGAWAVHAQFDRRPGDDIPGLERDRANANGLTVGAVVSALISVGTGVTVAVLR